MAEPSQARVARRWLPVAGLLLLSFLWAIDSLRSDLFPHSFASAAPSQESSLGHEAVSFLLLAIAAALFSAVRSTPWPSGRQLSGAIAVGLGLFAVPAVLVPLSSSWVSATTRVAIFSLVPVFTVVLSPHLGSNEEPSSTAGLIGALAAVAGTLCIFPLQLPGSIPSAAAIAGLVFAALCLAAANCHAVRFAHATQTGAIAPFAAIATSAAATALVASSLLIEPKSRILPAFLPQPLWSALLPLPALLILFWLMPRMTAVRMTTRFVLAPLIAVLLGIALEQPSVSLRIWIGLVLIAAGAGWLIFAPAQESDADTLPLNL
jgi:drug/metabolite transporter (DMT)-like permease